jgi:hypothetical protein
MPAIEQRRLRYPGRLALPWVSRCDSDSGRAPGLGPLASNPLHQAEGTLGVPTQPEFHSQDLNFKAGRCQARDMRGTTQGTWEAGPLAPPARGVHRGYVGGPGGPTSTCTRQGPNQLYSPTRFIPGDPHQQPVENLNLKLRVEKCVVTIVAGQGCNGALHR